MASSPPRARLAQLWQLPLLLISLGLFAYAAFLFINPGGGMSITQKIDIAKIYLRQERPDAAIEQLNKILQTEKLDRENEGNIHLLLSEALAAGQKQKRINIPINHVRIIEQIRLAMGQGVVADTPVYVRMGESYEALDRPNEALLSYRRAVALDGKQSLSLQRKIISLQMAQGENGPAEASLDLYLKNPEITSSERAVALAERAQLLIERGGYHEAKVILDEALKLNMDPIAQGQVNYRLGYCAFKLGDPREAERLLRVSRDQLRTQHPLDGDAAYLLGRIYLDRNQPQTANTFFQSVIVSHPDAGVAPLARLGRALCRVMLADDEAGLSDLHDLTIEVSEKKSRARHKPEAVAGMRQAAGILVDHGNYQAALEVLANEQTLDPNPPANFYSRLGGVYEKRADQLEKSIAVATAVDKIRRGQQVRDMRTRAGDAYIAYSRALTIADDKGYGEALWKGIDLYDRAANIQCTISALELFATERPDDALASDALLRLGRAYQAAGLFDKAIASFQRNQFRYPQSLAASKSAVPLAQAYIAKGPEYFNKAETVLMSVVDNNPLLTPQAEEFKQALFELAQLYYRTGRYEESVSRLEEMTQRYPKDERMGQLLFLMADSYRKSASLLNIRNAVADATQPRNANALGDEKPVAMDLAEAANAKRIRLSKAKELYDRDIELYRTSPPRTDIDKLYQRLSHFYRADCLYDLGNFEDAIKLYDAAAFRYQEDPSALAAYVQIVNSYCALGKIEEAKTANERAKWLLRRMPPDAFSDGAFSMPKAYWEQWLKWTSVAGMW